MARQIFTGLVFAALLGLARHGDASIIVDALYRMGEADPGAVAGNTSNTTTVDSATSGLGGGGDLTIVNNNVVSNTATYSANVAAPGSHLSTNFSFDPTGANGSYYANTSAVPYATNFGVEAWVNVSSFATNRGGLDISTLVYDGNSGAFANGSGMGLLISNNGTQNVFGALVGGVTPYPFVPQSGAITLGQWYQVAVVDTHNASGPDTQTLYVNGVAVGSATIGNPGTTYTLANHSGVYIGSDNAGDGFNGLLDSVALFHFAQGGFDPSELAGIGVPEPSTFVLAGIGLIGLLVARRRRK